MEYCHILLYLTTVFDSGTLYYCQFPTYKQQHLLKTGVHFTVGRICSSFVQFKEKLPEKLIAQ